MRRAVAFVGESLSPVRPGLVVIAGRAAKARGPTRLEQPRRAGGLIRKATYWTSGFISRADVANFLVKQIDDNSLFH